MNTTQHTKQCIFIDIRDRNVSSDIHVIWITKCSTMYHFYTEHYLMKTALQ